MEQIQLVTARPPASDGPDQRMFVSFAIFHNDAKLSPNSTSGNFILPMWHR